MPARHQYINIPYRAGKCGHTHPKVWGDRDAPTHGLGICPPSTSARIGGKDKNGKMRIEFFMAMVPPTITHQAKKLTVKNGKAITYNSPELNAAREKLRAHLSKYIPQKPMTGPVWLGVKWCFPAGVSHWDGEYKISKPDTDNLEKALKDVMEDLGFFNDDAQVASEHVEKFWADVPGIYVTMWEIEEEQI